MPVADKPELKTLFSVYQAILNSGFEVKIYATEGDSLVSRTRNSHISVFINEYKDFDYFISIDSDLEILNTNKEDNIFKKLISHNEDFVGGLYALKNQEFNASSSLSLQGENKILYNIGLVEMQWLSSGCWCLKRSVIEKMINFYPELAYEGDGPMFGKTCYGLYMPMIKEIEMGRKKYLSEDWSFNERWKEIGGKIYADTSIKLRHIGKYSYELWN